MCTEFDHILCVIQIILYYWGKYKMVLFGKKKKENPATPCCPRYYGNLSYLLLFIPFPG